MRKITLQKFSMAILLCALSCIFASEPFAQSSIPIGKQQKAADDKPFATNTSSQSPCDAVATIDSLAIELLSNPTNDATVYINIYGQKGETAKNYVRLWQIKRHIEKRNLSSRTKITTGELRAVGSTEFWIVPAGKQPPPVVPAEWDYKLSSNLQQLDLPCYDDSGDDITPKLLAEFLSHNPNMQAEIRIKETSVKAYRKIAKEAAEYLIKNGVPRKGIKTVRLNSQPGPETYTLWISSGQPINRRLN